MLFWEWSMYWVCKVCGQKERRPQPPWWWLSSSPTYEHMPFSMLLLCEHALIMNHVTLSYKNIFNHYTLGENQRNANSTMRPLLFLDMERVCLTAFPMCRVCFSWEYGFRTSWRSRQQERQRWSELTGKC